MPPRIATHLSWIAMVVLVMFSAAAAGAEFLGLGHLPDDQIFFHVRTFVSSDGSVVAGMSSSALSKALFVWTREDGLLPLGIVDLHGLSDDGSTAIGTRAAFPHLEGLRWDRADGLMSLGQFRPSGVSSNGSVIVGTQGEIVGTEGSEGFRWTAEAGLTPLEFSDIVTVVSSLRVSGDGSVIAGFANRTHPFQLSSAGFNSLEGEVWPYQGGTIPIHFEVIDISSDGAAQVWARTDQTNAFGSNIHYWSEQVGPVHVTFGGANALAADGSVVVGWSGTLTQPGRAFRWTVTDGLEDLGVTPAGMSSEALDVSADGSVIVGNFWMGNFGGDDRLTTPFYWDERHGARPLEDVLVAAGAELAGWTLRETLAISADGRTIVGWGINPAGDAEVFRAVIPEPASWLLGIVAVLSFTCGLRWSAGHHGR